jgi:hypothetical protein
MQERLPGYMEESVVIVEVDMRTIYFVWVTDEQECRSDRRKKAKLVWGYVMNTNEDVHTTWREVDDGYEIMVMGSNDRMEP